MNRQCKIPVVFLFSMLSHCLAAVDLGDPCLLQVPFREAAPFCCSGRLSSSPFL